MNFKNVTTDTWLRTIVLIVALVNQALQIFGVNTLPFTGEEVAEVITIVITFVATIWSWWKNNSFTAEAQEVDQILEERRNDK